MMRKNHRAQKTDIFKGILVGSPLYREYGHGCGNRPFAIVVNYKHTKGMAKATTGTTPQSG
jgi:hypothetical protein